MTPLSLSCCARVSFCVCRLCRMHEESEGLAFDSESSSVIRLEGGPYNGMVLYLCEVSSYLALVCLLRAENFNKQGA
jgi:hypothetical protein